MNGQNWYQLGLGFARSTRHDPLHLTAGQNQTVVQQEFVKLYLDRLCFSVLIYSKPSSYGFYVVWLDDCFKECMKSARGNCLGLFLLEVSGPRVFSGIGLSIVSFMCFYWNSVSSPELSVLMAHTSGNWPPPHNCWQNTESQMCVWVLLFSL